MDFEDDRSNNVLEHSLYWVQAMRVQGARILDANRCDEKGKYLFGNLRVMEQQFFLTATNKARRWIEDLEENFINGDTDLLRFLDFIEPAILVRNKREHDDEYHGSRAKNEILSDASADGSNLKLHVGQSVTVYRNGRILLGGVFDVELGIQSAKIMAKKLIKLQHQYWDERALRLGPGTLDHFKAPENLKEK